MSKSRKIRSKVPFRKRGCHEVTGDIPVQRVKRVSPCRCDGIPLLRKGAFGTFAHAYKIKIKRGYKK